jgi:Ca2+-binding RTX toxin-like protein
MVSKIGTFGNDLLIGSNGADSLQGSFGDDELRGLDGDDVLSGGGDDFIDGSDLANFIRAGGGNDFILAREGADTVHGDDGADFIGGGEGLDTLYGGAGADFLNGEEDHDIVDGGGGADEIFGGNGNDLIVGGGGSDTFVFQPNDSGVGTGNRDFVADFSQAQNDKIELTIFDGLDFIGESGFSAPDQVRFFHSNGNTVIAINTAGNSGAEMQIELDGVINLTVGDFVL